METLLDLIDRLATRRRSWLREAAAAHGLATVQLEALRYLSVCNRYSDSPATVAEHIGTTRGTMSQTLQVLERRGLIVKLADERDGRVVHCQLTLEGRELLAQVNRSDPGAVAVMALAAREPDAAAAIRRLSVLIARIAGDGPVFGTCHSCAKLVDQRCTWVNEPVAPDDMRRLCRGHVPRAGG